VADTWRAGARDCAVRHDASADLPLLVEDAVGRDRTRPTTPSSPGRRRPPAADVHLRHPALAAESRLALTLRLVCGLTTAEVARAFLVSESTMAARVTRAKGKIAAARIPFRMPDPHELPERIDTVLTVVHLVFTTGHTAPSGDRLVRGDGAAGGDPPACCAGCCRAAARWLAAGLILLTDARQPAAWTRRAPVLLADQDRTRWDRRAIDEGWAWCARRWRRGRRAASR
jgi:RNA polymerase sigma-70 factor (ECF subfamily)